VAVSVTPFREAVMITVSLFATSFVVNTNVVADVPAGTTACEGTDRLVGSLDASVTAVPPAGATPLKPTWPPTRSAPVTELRFSLIETSEGGASKIVVLALEPL
jgi:hypothetical protein